MRKKMRFGWLRRCGLRGGVWVLRGGICGWAGFWCCWGRGFGDSGAGEG